MRDLSKPLPGDVKVLSFPQHLMKAHIGAIVILAVYFLLGGFYSVVTPLFEASDEIWHYPFVQHLATGGGLPIQDPQNVQLWRQEGSQPPLYYFLGALLTFWIDTSDLGRLLWKNPHADLGVPSPDGNVNFVIHTPAEAFPWSKTALAVHLVRFLSVFLGGVTVLFTYLLFLGVWPEHKLLATAAAGFMAFNPMFLFISGSVNNDNLVNALSAVTLWVLIKILEQPTDRWVVILGCVLGLAALSKISALGLLPLTALVILIISLCRRSAAEFARMGLLVFGPTLLIAGWWYLRNWTLYRDPLGWNAFLAITGVRYPQPTLLQLLGEREGFIMSFWGFFGGLNVPTDPWFYTALNLTTLAGALGFGLYLIRNRATLPALPLAILSLWPVLVFGALTRWASLTLGFQGRLIFPALPVLALWITRGWGVLGFRGLFAGLGASLLGAMAVLAPVLYIIPAYQVPSSMTRSASIPNPVMVNFGNQIALLGYDVEHTEIRPGDTLGVTLYWLATSSPDKDYSVFVHLVDEVETIVAQRDRYPARGLWPTSLWEPGEIRADRYALRLPLTAYSSSQAHLEIGLYDYATGQRLPMLGANNHPVGDYLRLGEITILPAAESPYPNPVELHFGDRVVLVGYELDRRSVRPGETITLTLWWQAIGPVKENWTVFTHILGKENAIWGQHDSPPQEGAYPTSQWVVGEIVEDIHSLTINPQTPAGTYAVEIGLYSPVSGERLPLLGEGGFIQDNRTILTLIRIQ